MNATRSHEEHLARHVARLRRTIDAATVRALLETAGLRDGLAGLKNLDGGDVGPSECASYLDALRRVLGDAEYYPARVNFILARCSSMAETVATT